MEHGKGEGRNSDRGGFIAAFCFLFLLFCFCFSVSAFLFLLLLLGLLVWRGVVRRKWGWDGGKNKEVRRRACWSCAISSGAGFFTAAYFRRVGSARPPSTASGPTHMHRTSTAPLPAHIPGNCGSQSGKPVFDFCLHRISTLRQEFPYGREGHAKW